ncbi:normal mucosa of esophagus-specific gene 1 protein-like [Ptychodera flava]|uniref:normal mucosa of esophagus-specific gene 1 protein-like n=1 Tax=Ptychodera flava TaxID=63121 RepID=UPI00396A72C1
MTFSRLISLKFLKTHFELIPVVILTSGVACMSASYVFYMATHKSEVSWIKNLSAPWDAVDPTRRQKFITVTQKYEPNMEIVKLRQEISAAYAPKRA